MVVDVFEVGVVVGSRIADGEAAGLVVARDENQCFIRMLCREIDCDLHRVRKGKRIVNRGTRVIGMARPVDLATLYHHEETLVAVEHRDALLNIVLEGPCGFCAVDFIAHGLAVREVFRDDDRLACVGRKRLRFSLGLYDRITGLRREIIQIGLGDIFLVACGLEQCAARKIVKVACDELKTDFVVIVAARLMRIEGGGSRVVEVYGGNDADFIAKIVLEGFGNGRILLCLCLVHVQHAAIGFVSAGNGRRRGGGVRAERAGVIGGCGTRNRELHKVEHLICGENGVLILVDAQVSRCGLELRIGHAVADEQKDIFRRGDRGGVLIQNGDGGGARRGSRFADRCGDAKRERSNQQHCR